MVRHKRLHVFFSNFSVRTFDHDPAITVKLCRNQKSQQLFVYACDARSVKKRNTLFDLVLNNPVKVILQAALVFYYGLFSNYSKKENMNTNS